MVTNGNSWVGPSFPQLHLRMCNVLNGPTWQSGQEQQCPARDSAQPETVRSWSQVQACPTWEPWYHFRHSPTMIGTAITLPEALGLPLSAASALELKPGP